MGKAPSGSERLLKAQVTALKAEERYRAYIEQEKKDSRILLVDENLLTLTGMGRQLVRLLEVAVDRLVKPALKRNPITYRTGRAVRDALRKGIRRAESPDESP